MKKSIITILTLLVLNIALYAISTTAQGTTPQCVGIGTTTPTAELDVQGNAKISGNVDAGIITVHPQDLLLTTSTGVEGGQIELKGATGKKSWVLDSYDNGLRFFNPQDTGNEVKVRLGSDAGGAIELGSDASDATPYIDFRSKGTPDFNARIINDKDKTLTVVGNLEVTGTITKAGVTGSTGAEITTQEGFVYVKGAGAEGCAPPGGICDCDPLVKKCDITVTLAGGPYTGTPFIMCSATPDIFPTDPPVDCRLKDYSTTTGVAIIEVKSSDASPMDGTVEYTVVTIG